MLGRSPGFTVVVVLTLGLSIGANSAIFSVIDGVLLKPLPYPRAERLARVFYRSKAYAKFPVNPWDFLDFRFDFSEERPGNGNVVILSDRLWRRQFGAASDILGRKIVLDSRSYTVVGVMPPGVDHPGNAYNSVAYGDTVDAWYPFEFDGTPANRGSHYLEGIGRLRPGVTASQVAADFNTIMAGLATHYPGDQGWTIYMVPLYQEIVGPVHRLLLVLLGSVGLVLLIACVNTANLLLARATARQREIAVRAALGAGRWRLVRQMLAECLLMAILGGGLGALLAAAGVRALVVFLPPGFPRLAAIHVNGLVFGFTALIALATGLFFGLVPALQSSRADLQQGLREGGRGATATGRQTRLRSALVVGEVSLACVLLAGAGVMLRSFLNLLHTDAGFQPAHVLTARISLPDATYKTNATIARFYQTLLDGLSSLPGVQAAGAGTDLPWTGYDDNLGGFTIEGKKAPPNEEFHGRYHVASPDYFRAIGIPLVRGRYFTARDTKGAPRALIVNQAMARRYWPNEDPVGWRIDFFDDKPKDSDWFTIVGVVGDVKDKPQSSAAEPAFWWPVQQQPFGFGDMSIALRSGSDPAPLTGHLREAVRGLDPSLAVAHVRLLDQVAAGVVLHAAHRAVSGGAVCWACLVARGHRHLRRDLLLRQPADARVRHARGSRCQLLGRDAPGDGAAVATAALACYPSARRATSADTVAALRAE